MFSLDPVTLEGNGVRLEPLSMDHAPGLRAISEADELWRLFFTWVPEPDGVEDYIRAAQLGHAAGGMLPWAVRDTESGDIIGSSRYHDIVAAVPRVEIGYTWYATRAQRTHINTATKLLLLGHGFDTLGCLVVGLRTDIFNHRSQRAIEAIGARKDGIIRAAAVRRDGSPRDTVMYSILRDEWSGVRKHLETRLVRLRSGA